MTDSTLAHCPFCGGRQIQRAVESHFEKQHECQECGARGPRSSAGSDLDDEWNARSMLPLGDVSRCDLGSLGSPLSSDEIGYLCMRYHAAQSFDRRGPRVRMLSYAEKYHLLPRMLATILQMERELERRMAAESDRLSTAECHVSRLMKALSVSFANADIEYVMRDGQAFVRVAGVPMGWIPGEMLNDPHPEQMGDVIRDYLIEKAMSG